MLDGLVIDRNRLTHGESNRATLLEMKARKAQRDLDIAEFERIQKEADKMLMKVVVALPDGWLPQGVTLDSPNWLESVSQAQFEQIMVAAQPNQPGEKKV
jgi:hypothetical protein